SRGECGHDDPLARSKFPQCLPVWGHSIRARLERQPRRLAGNRNREGSARLRMGGALALNSLAEQEQAQCDRAVSCHLTPPEACFSLDVVRTRSAVSYTAGLEACTTSASKGSGRKCEKF